MSNKNLCIIPARGGSKRIPRKNIKNFMGKPIIAYSIQAAIQSNLYDEVMVSTDDDEIAKISRDYGAKVPFMRSETNADDFATTMDVLLEVVKEYQNLGGEFDYICCIYPTAPFVTSTQLINAYGKLTKEEFDVVFPVVPFNYPIQRSLKMENSKLQFFFPEFENARSQDLQGAFHDAGQFYFLKLSSLLKQKTLFSKNTGAIILNELEAQDIDNETDWKIAEIKYEFLQNSK